ncbi:unnamed protein product [Heterosigma akashiwo]
MNLFTAHERAECPRRVVTCDLCQEVLHADALQAHQAKECRNRVVKCRKGCGEKVKFQELELHETRLCQLTRWSCQCGAEVKLLQRKAHLRQCRAYIECWEGVLQRLVEAHGKGSLERRLARLMGARKVAPEIALCALGESSGDVKVAAQKLRNRAYYEEMKLVCEVCNIKRYVSAKKRSKRKKKTQAAGSRVSSRPEGVVDGSTAASGHEGSGEDQRRSYDPGAINVLDAADVKEVEEEDRR